MIASPEKSLPRRGKMLIIITGKGIFRNIFDVAVVRLIEALGRDRKYGIGAVGGYGSVGDRVCNRHQKYL